MSRTLRGAVANLLSCEMFVYMRGAIAAGIILGIKRIRVNELLLDSECNQVFVPDFNFMIFHASTFVRPAGPPTVIGEHPHNEYWFLGTKTKQQPEQSFYLAKECNLIRRELSQQIPRLELELEDEARKMNFSWIDRWLRLKLICNDHNEQWARVGFD